jgi:uncharacterized UBP type Zn finger protein
MPPPTLLLRATYVPDQEAHMADTCTHLDQIRVLSVNQPGCQECLASGGTWMHLRLCVECGQVGCCDNSPNQHATRHFQATGHPIMRSYEPGEDWWWCYVDELAFELKDVEPARASG